MVEKMLHKKPTKIKQPNGTFGKAKKPSATQSKHTQPAPNAFMYSTCNGNGVEGASAYTENA